MGTFTICIHDKKTNRDYFLEWCTIVDSPTTYGMDRITYIDYWRELNGYDEYQNDKFIKSLDNAKIFGTSLNFDKGQRLDQIIECNHAGDNGKKLTKNQIIEKYCRKSKYYVESKLIYLSKDYSTPLSDYNRGDSFLPHIWAGLLGISCSKFKELLDSEEEKHKRFQSYFSFKKIEA